VEMCLLTSSTSSCSGTSLVLNFGTTSKDKSHSGYDLTLAFWLYLSYFIHGHGLSTLTSIVAWPLSDPLIQQPHSTTTLRPLFLRFLNVNYITLLYHKDLKHCLPVD
jgi:hypothetical protein